MKKYLCNLFALVALLLLTACGQVQKTEKVVDATTEQTVEFVVTPLEGDATTETLSFNEGDSVLDILMANHVVEEDNGMVTAIDGIKQQPDKTIYWMYKVNDSMADKGAGNLYPQAGDKIEFYQEQFN